MVVTPYQIQERNMMAVTGSGPEYWLVDARKTITASTVKVLPSEPQQETVENEKSVATTEREGKFTNWTTRSYKVGDGESEPGVWGQSECDMGRDGVSQCNVRIRPEVELSEEIWSISHMAMLLSFWVIVFILGVWEFTIWYAHRNDTTTDESCDRLLIYYLISSISGLLIFPFVMFITISSMHELDKRRLQKMAGISVPNFTRHSVLMSTWLSWGRVKLFVTCLVFVGSTLEYFWVISGVMFIATGSDCGTAYEQGVYLYFILSGLIILFALTIPLLATYFITHKSTNDVGSLKQSYDRSFHSASPSYYDERPQSPKPSALAALKALKHGHSPSNTEGDTKHGSNHHTARAEGHPKHKHGRVHASKSSSHI